MAKVSSSKIVDNAKDEQGNHSVEAGAKEGRRTGVNRRQNKIDAKEKPVTEKKNLNSMIGPASERIKDPVGAALQTGKNIVDNNDNFDKPNRRDNKETKNALRKKQ